MKEEEIYRLKTIPEPVLDIIIFVGDGFIGEVWSRKEIEEDKQKWVIIQWEPETPLLNRIKNSERGKAIIDSTGRTITRRYPKTLVQSVNDNPWARRIVVFTDFLGNKVDLINIDKKLTDEVERLQYENSSLSNEVFNLQEELSMLKSRLTEYLKNSTEIVKMVGSARWDAMAEEKEQARYMSGPEEEQQR